MPRTILAACLALTAGLCSVLAVQGGAMADRLLVPGERVGPVTGEMTEEDLQTIAPADQIRREVRSVGESFYSCGTLVFADTNDEIFVRWAGPLDEVDAPDYDAFVAECENHPPLRRPFQVTIEPVSNTPPSWATEDGLSIGITLAEAEAILGRRLQVSVCDCDFGGTVSFVDDSMMENIRLWSGYPPDVDTVLAGKVDTEQDYLLQVSDIPEEMMTSFLISRINIELS